MLCLTVHCTTHWHIVSHKRFGDDVQTAFYPERCHYCTVIAPVEWVVVTNAEHSVRWTNGAQQVGITHQSHHGNPPSLYLSPLPLLLILLPGDIVS